jgi:Sensors of blue-light using FAD
MRQRLIYFSGRDPSCRALADLVAGSAKRNRGIGVTGMLVADEKCFLQVLEGEREVVSALFVAISRDTRHNNVTLVEVGDIATASYPDWGMTRLENISRVTALWRQIAPGTDFHPPSMSARQITDFLRLAAFEAMSAHEAPARD